MGPGYYKVLDLYVEVIPIRLSRTNRVRTRQTEPGSSRAPRQLDESGPSRVQSCDPATDRQTDETHDAEECEAEENWDETDDGDGDHSDVDRDICPVLGTRNTSLMGRGES